ncbi:MAG: tRNA (adenosine(37)-N6)-threonylcarbamoyltransferase complex ATPase subunit type 1 TsaE [Alphaproteobacteria bacterium]|nr:tRNA (adenosine(37)-N6)-threonylcarbamoyltransferase complex ATPase subunit type 1 TsaE [Alphaproteobacteria bacterium]
MQQENVYISEGPEETAALARKVAQLLKPRDVIFLKGNLGAGKSTFARSLVQALCGTEIEVPSPTFTLVQTYETPSFTLWHFDLYRLKYSEEAYELGIEEAYIAGVSLIEWPERLGTLLPKDYLEIELKYGSHENERILCLRGWKDRLS